MAIIQWLLDLSSSLGYGGIFLLMTIESSFVPFPSEIVIPPAAYLAAQGEMNVGLVILFGILGSLCGAIINYFLAMWLGRPIIYSLTEKKWTSVFLINSKKVEKAERYFLKYGGLSTFIGRLFPAVRQLISLPAGFSRMKFLPFIFYTTLGAGIWVIVLAAIGYYLGVNEEFIGNLKNLLYLILGVGILGFVIFYFLGRRKKRNQ